MIKRKIPWKKLFRYGVPLLLTFLWLGFIFGNSLQDGVESGNQSHAVYRFVNALVQKLGFDFTVSEHFIRKLAHFGEFAILSLLYIIDLLAFAVISVRQDSLRRSTLRTLWVVPICFLCAGIDEFLQRFSSGRAPQFSDMLIDTAGAATSAVLFCLGLCLIRAHVKRQERKKSYSPI